jgi:hypothetical protein
MDRRKQPAEDDIATFIASAAKLPLLDAAFELWRRRYQLDAIEGRPTAEEVRINRTLTPEQSSAKYRRDRDHAHEGPMFFYVKRAHPRADDDAIRQAIVTAVKFEDATFTHFSWDGDFWECVLRAVAQRPRNIRIFWSRAIATPATTSPTTTSELQHDPEKCAAVFRKDHAHK